jgi:capsular polysaccharide biosynthesis protein
MKKNYQLDELAQIFKRRGGWLIFGLMIGLGAIYNYTNWLMPSQYEGTIEYVIVQKAETSDARNNTLSANTYKDMVTGANTMNQLSKELKKQNINLSASKLSKSISVSQTDDSALLSVQATGASRAVVKQMLASLTNVYVKQVDQSLKVDQTIVPLDSVIRLDTAGTNIYLLYILGATLGLMSAMIAVIGFDLSRKSIYIPAEVAALDWQNFGEIKK